MKSNETDRLILWTVFIRQTSHCCGTGLIVHFEWSNSLGRQFKENLGIYDKDKWSYSGLKVEIGVLFFGGAPLYQHNGIYWQSRKYENNVTTKLI